MRIQRRVLSIIRIRWIALCALAVALPGGGMAPAFAQATGSGTVSIRFTSFFGPAQLSGASGPILTGSVNGVTPDFGPPGSSFDTGRGNGTTYDTGLIGATLSGGTFPLNGSPTTRVSLLDGETLAGSPYENIFSWAPAIFTNVAVGQQFKLGTLTFQNGSWFGGGANGAADVSTKLGFRVNTVSASGDIFNQQRTLQLIHTVHAPFPNDPSTFAGQQAAADWVTLYDPLNLVNLSTFRVYDLGAAPVGSSNVGTVDLMGRFGSLDIEGFANPSGGFLTAGDQPLAAVPEPSIWALLLSGIGLVGAIARRQRQISGLPAALVQRCPKE